MTDISQGLCPTGVSLYHTHSVLLLASIKLAITGSNKPVDELADKAWQEYRIHRDHCKICGKMEQDEHPY